MNPSEFHADAVTLDGNARLLARTFDVRIYRAVIVTAAVDNGQAITIATTQDRATGGNGYQLAPGDSIPIAINQLAKIWIKGTMGDAYSWIAS